MSKEIVKEIAYWSVDLELHHGDPPEEQLRFALDSILLGMARRVKNSSISDGQWFPLSAHDFPLRMTLSSEQLLWDFELKLTLENSSPILKTDEENPTD